MTTQSASVHNRNARAHSISNGAVSEGDRRFTVQYQNSLAEIGITMTQHIVRTRTGGVEVVTLKRPPVNALDLSLTEELAGAFTGIAKDPSARAVVLTADGSTFCAGLDLKLVPRYSKSEQHRLLDALNRMILGIYACRLPVIAAINGHAIAGGLVLALCCDWRVVADVPLRVALAEVSAAVPYPIAALEVVRSELSSQSRRRLVLFGETIGVKEGLTNGIFDESSPAHGLVETAIARAARYAQLPPLAFARIKRQLKQPALTAIESAISRGTEPLREEWLSEETALFASRGTVRRRGL